MSHLSDLNARAGRFYDWIAAHTAASLFFSIAVAVLFLFPGIFALPPVDRTEVIFAQMARQMLETLNFAEARFQDNAILGQPFGTLWIQAAFAWLTGVPDAMVGYRMASATFTIAAICLLFLLSRGLYGNMAALLAALWLAGAPLIVLHGHLALSKPLLLPFLVAAQLALAHVYVGTKPGQSGMATLFWLAQAAAAIVDGLALASVSLATVIALAIWERSPARFRSLGMHPAALVWLAVVMLWGYSHVVYFAGKAQTVEDFWASIWALVEPQHMHLSAPPGAFILLLAVGILPILVLLLPAIDTIRQQLSDRKMKFLLAWIVPYILVLEFFSTKPPTYMVQSVIPAIALLGGLAMVRVAEARDSSIEGSQQWWLAGWLLTCLLLPFALLAFAWLSGLQIDLLPVAAAFAMSFFFAGSVFALRRNLVYIFAFLSFMASLSIYPFFFSHILPSYKSAWIGVQLKDALDRLGACAAWPATVLSYTEPSIVFMLGTQTDLTQSEDRAKHALIEEKRFVVVDSRHSMRLQKRFSEVNFDLQPIACIDGINYARAEKVRLEIYIPPQNLVGGSCQPLERYVCKSEQ